MQFWEFYWIAGWEEDRLSCRLWTDGGEHGLFVTLARQRLQPIRLKYTCLT
jgi:hypothetical protein